LSGFAVVKNVGGLSKGLDCVKWTLNLMIRKEWKVRWLQVKRNWNDCGRKIGLERGAR